MSRGPGLLDGFLKEARRRTELNHPKWFPEWEIRRHSLYRLFDSLLRTSKVI